MGKQPYMAMCGDVGFVGRKSGKSFISDVISELTTGVNESRSVAQHQFQVIKHGEILEAGSMRKRSVVIRPLSERFFECEDDGSHYVIFRPPTTEEQQEKIDTIARKKLNGKRYGYIELLLQVADGLLRKVGLLREGRPLFTRLGAIAPWTVICSGVSNWCLYAAKILPRRFLSLAPDGTFDEAIRRGWRMVAMDEDGADYWGLPQKQKGDAA
jgi:hypothetical protein